MSLAVSTRALVASRLAYRRCPGARGIASGGASNSAEPASPPVEIKKALTRRELYKVAIADASKGKTRALQGAGATLAVGGAGILFWQHCAALASWNLLGGGLLAVGAGLVRASSAAGSRMSSGSKATSKFKLTLLNDTERWKADGEVLQKLLGGEAWPAGAPLAKAGAEEKRAELGRVAEALKEHSASVADALKAGESAQLIQARLRPRTFVFDFQAGSPGGVPGSPGGGMKKRLEDLRDTVTFILHSSTPFDEVVLRLHSPGGGVSDYGLAAAQLLRFRRQGLKLTACVDKVAASGGYMMACTANEIVAAPFAFVGSIGVIAQLPNFSKLLQRNDIDFLQFTGGRWKRTVDPFSPPTEEGIAKMKEDISRIHDAFKEHVAGQREGLDIEEVATGEVFLGLEAKDRGLVDSLGTSDEVLAERMKMSDVVEISFAPKKRGLRDLLEGKVEAAESLFSELWCSFGPGRGAVTLESRDPKIQ